MMKVNKDKMKKQNNVYWDQELMNDVDQNVDISLVDVSEEGIGIRTKEPMSREKLISFNLVFYEKALSRCSESTLDQEGWSFISKWSRNRVYA